MLEEQRQERAQRALEAYDFGDVVAEMSGWESEVPGREWVRTVYIESADTYSDDTSTERTRFHVRFANTESSEIVEVFARNANGADFGFLDTPLELLNDSE